MGAAGSTPRHRLEDFFPASARADDTALLPVLTPADREEPEPSGAEPRDRGPSDRDYGGHPTAPTGRRLVLSLRAAVVVTVLAAACAAAWWWSAGSASPAVSTVRTDGRAEGTAGHEPGGAAHSEAAPDGAEATAAPDRRGTEIAVHVVGAVRRPGVYRLDEGSRVQDAVAAAGGAQPGADVHRLNLAAVLVDGARIHVPQKGEEAEEDPGAGALVSSGQPGGTTGAASGAGGAKVNLNTATAEELTSLPRVGPVLAQRIVDYRAAHGRFTAPEDIDAVEGVGPKMLESLLPLVTV
ncbi:hypothetical protein GCM10028789_22730 [Sinomonas halotolerans]